MTIRCEPISCTQYPDTAGTVDFPSPFAVGLGDSVNVSCEEGYMPGVSVIVNDTETTRIYPSFGDRCVGKGYVARCMPDCSFQSNQSCLRASCPPFHQVNSIAAGSQSDAIAIGETFKATCPAGFRLFSPLGDQTHDVNCNSDCSLSSKRPADSFFMLRSAFTCVLASCGNFTLPNHSTLIFSSVEFPGSTKELFYGDRVAIGCNVGYMLEHTIPPSCQ